MHAFHHDEDQWIEPKKFNPERFNSKSPFFKRPNGQPRNTFAFSPFMGGKRACIGKTFAEVIIRFTVPIMLYHLDFKLDKPEYRAKKPQFNFLNRSDPEFLANLTYKKVVDQPNPEADK